VAASTATATAGGTSGATATAADVATATATAAATATSTATAGDDGGTGTSTAGELVDADDSLGAPLPPMVQQLEMWHNGHAIGERLGYACGANLAKEMASGNADGGNADGGDDEPARRALRATKGLDHNLQVLAGYMLDRARLYRMQQRSQIA